MGFLNQSIAQVRDLFASMTPAARITAALLIGVIAVSLGYLFQDYSGGAKEPLLNGDSITAGEADAMQAAIAVAQLSDYDRKGNQIFVPRGQKDEYLAAVANAGALPANLDTLLLDETSEMGLFVDRKTKEERMKAARERMLSMIIRKMDGVQDANVLFDIREPRGFEKRLITATVSVRPAPGEELTYKRIKMIRMAVAGATAGLDPKHVSILNLADTSQYVSGQEIDPEAYDDPYYQTRIRYEEQMKARIAEHLSYIPGVRVQVTAELDDTLTAQARVIKSEGDVQAIREESELSNTKESEVDDRGRPGLTANGPNRAPPEEAVAQNTREANTEGTQTENFVPTTEDVRTSAGLVPVEVRASIAIPSDFLVAVWREQQNPPAGADQFPTATDIDQLSTNEETKITNSIAQLLPRKPGEEIYPQVRVTVYQSLTPPPQVEPSMATNVLVWASANSGSLLMAGLALVSLVMLRSMVKSIPSPETNVILQSPMAAGGTGGLGGESEGEGEGEGEEGGSRRRGLGGDYAGSARQTEKGRPKLRLKKGASLKDDLTEMVRDDPDAAAAILRTWISSAG